MGRNMSPPSNKAEDHFKSLPEKHCDIYDFDYQPTLDGEVDELLCKWLEEKLLAKQLKKDMNLGVIYGKPEEMKIQKWKGHTIKSILTHPQGKEVLKKFIESVKAQGHQIFNTNLPNDILAA
jgi:hypothetical protein